jgi:phosphopantothenoylcysteine synthetase/decarboxylase
MITASAVADFRPKNLAKDKIKRGRYSQIETNHRDITKTVAEKGAALGVSKVRQLALSKVGMNAQVVVGFAAVRLLEMCIR